MLLLSSHSTLLEWKKVSWWIKKILVRVHKKNSDSFVNPEVYFKSSWGPWTTSTFWQRENNQEIAINILLYNKLIVISFRLAFMILEKRTLSLKGKLIFLWVLIFVFGIFSLQCPGVKKDEKNPTSYNIAQWFYHI